MKELSLAGTILLYSDTLPEIRRIVSVDDFQNPLCRSVFASACELADNGETVDPVTIQSRSKQKGVNLEKDWICSAMDLVPTSAYAAMYAGNVAEEAKCRRIKALALQILDNQVSSSNELVADMQRGIEQIHTSSFSQGIISPDERIHSLFDHIVKSGGDQFIPSGYKSLDNILGGGFIRGGLYIIGARPAIGKSTFALNLAEGIKGNVLFMSLEMSPDIITAKQFSRLTGLSTSDILGNRGGDEMWEKLAAASAVVSRSGIKVNRRYDLTPGQLMLQAQGAENLKAIIVDYLGIMLPNTPGNSMYERVSSISRDLKRIALQLNVPVICLAQLSRSTETRQDKHPQLSDLRDSGSIEQDADAVMFLYRSDYYNMAEADGGPSVVELSVAKNRHGKLGKVEFLAFFHTSYFRERQKEVGYG